MSEALATADRLFHHNEGLDVLEARRAIAPVLDPADDGELFLEYRESEIVSLDDGRIRNASFDSRRGFGLRSVTGEAAIYAHAGEISDAALARAVATLQDARPGETGLVSVGPATASRPLYTALNPLAEMPFAARAALLGEIDAYARGADSRVVQVMASLAGEWQVVEILRADGVRAADIRPLVVLHVSVVMEQNGRRESGGHGAGGRETYSSVTAPEFWRAAVDKAIRNAALNLESIAAPAGEMPVVLGAGWPGILLHEAIGHGLEGDFNRKKTSAFAGLLGKRVGSKGVTVIDDGTIPDRRGSLTVDDEGTPTNRTVLIEDGILTGYIQDRQNARLMSMRATGNGRRQSYAHLPMPRMTNTIMLAGDASRDDMIRSIKRGLYAANFGGGQVDITSGKFVFSASEAYLIEDGRIGAPVKGATLIGNGPDALTKVEMIGADLELDPGIGTCGKNGQGVPVGVGQPTIKISGLTVGGTAA
ncbi:metalloprotease TldD [Acidiphilium iwatense]|uniref:Metalloprotease TldD n=1 Tax=Acidiphilium iwatense TaxID=768198 RepID=A0ABS9DRU5_9PROT|nr:metalloprotease TldD [Acidiphilium iwatense]MCF3945469.1 metalloprotease TldD [Acidiphilium iwatense]